MSGGPIRRSDQLVIIPAYNEEQTIQDVVVRAGRYADVCVVDDCSKDSTPLILGRLKGIHVIRHDRNTHIPGAILDGMRYAVSRNYRYAITMDAGASHSPDEIPLFMRASDADLLVGRRIERIDTPAYRRLLSATGNLAYNVCLDFPWSILRPVRYRDLTSGFRRYSNRAMRLLVSTPMRSRSFDFLFESAMLVCRAGMTIEEVPITYRFTNSSLRWKVIRDCLRTAMGAAARPRGRASAPGAFAGRASERRRSLTGAAVETGAAPPPPSLPSRFD